MRLICAICVICGYLRGVPLSDRIVEYQIHARLNPASKLIEGEETITYRHDGDEPLTTLQFHLYWNAFRDTRSTFMKEAGDFDANRAGSIEMTSPSAIRYLHPDDSNAEDRTVAEIALAEPVEPGQTITVHLTFRARFPGMIARAGYKHDLFMAGQWFPKLGVMQRGRWNTHQYHAWSEFFSDFGVYTVALTLPSAFVVAASGDLVSETRQGDLKTVTYRSEDVHDFAWAAWPRFRRIEERWRNVRLELYYAPEHGNNARRHLDAARATLEWYDRHVGPYPYPRLVIVDLPLWAADAAGMEYPTLVTTTMPWWAPRAVRLPEVMTIHEVGHQYFYGMLASNEFKEAWLDEGINSYTDAAIADGLYGRRDSWISLPGLHASDAGFYWRPLLARAPETDAVLQPSWRYWNTNSYGAMTYAKPLFLLRAVESMVGREAMEKALRLYFERWRFRHPTTQDFTQVVKESTGQNLDWFFQQALYRPSTLDYEISAVDGNRLRVRRLGDFEIPIEAAVHFAGGSSRRQYWDGRDRWHDFVFESPREFEWARITTSPLDTNHVNNSYSRRPSLAAGAKMAGLWAFLLQHLLEAMAWII